MSHNPLPLINGTFVQANTVNFIIRHSVSQPVRKLDSCNCRSQLKVNRALRLSDIGLKYDNGDCHTFYCDLFPHCSEAFQLFVAGVCQSSSLSSLVFPMTFLHSLTVTIENKMKTRPASFTID